MVWKLKIVLKCSCCLNVRWKRMRWQGSYLGGWRAGRVILRAVLCQLCQNKFVWRIMSVEQLHCKAEKSQPSLWGGGVDVILCKNKIMKHIFYTSFQEGMVLGLALKRDTFSGTNKRQQEVEPVYSMVCLLCCIIYSGYSSTLAPTQWMLQTRTGIFLVSHCDILQIANDFHVACRDKATAAGGKQRSGAETFKRGP